MQSFERYDFFLITINPTFIPFPRGTNSQSLEIAGTELGLAISLHLCNLLDREKSLQSTSDAGAVFTSHISYITSELDLHHIPKLSTIE